MFILLVEALKYFHGYKKDFPLLKVASSYKDKDIKE